jgi:hypothetical protein
MIFFFFWSKKGKRKIQEKSLYSFSKVIEGLVRLWGHSHKEDGETSAPQDGGGG